MKGNGALICLILSLISLQVNLAQETEQPEITTTITEVSNDQPSSESNNIELDSNLRSALLKALSDLEKEDDVQANEEDIVNKAQASVVTYSESVEENETVEPTQSSTQESPSKESEPQQDKPKASIVVLQKSEDFQAPSISSLEKSPIDPLKDVEQIITSASNSFVSQNPTHQPETRSLNRESVLQSEQKNFQFKSTGFPSLNSISNTESKKPQKTTLVEKFSIGKAVEEPVVVKNYVKAVGSTNSEVAYVKPATQRSNEAKDEVVTEKAVEVSTEENEAKVEQLQFFSAPLVAAFTVHQDEKGLPNKVEPIYKNGLNPKKEKVETSTLQQEQPQPTQTILQSSQFNSLDLQQRQKILEQELEKLRNQQYNFQRNYNQFGFNQAINQNFNQFDPVFTEPDRSVVTKLASIDPMRLLNQNSSPLINKFTIDEAIVPRTNSATVKTKETATESIVKVQNSKTSDGVSLVPSISYDPLEEAGKLPQNAQILPNKEPTGFHSYLKLPKLSNNQNFLAPNPNIVQPNFIQPVLLQQPGGLNIPQFPIQNNRFLKPENPQFPTPNRFLRQEQGTGNLGFNQNTFSIVPAQQPFAPKHELSFIPDNRFLRPEQPNFKPQNNRFLVRNNPQNFASVNQNRFFRSNLEASVSSPQNIHIQQSVQPFAPQSNRFFRSNQEGVLSPQNVIFNQPQSNRFLRSNQEGSYFSNLNGNFHTPVAQSYKYTNGFGFPNIPLH